MSKRNHLISFQPSWFAHDTNCVFKILFHRTLKCDWILTIMETSPQQQLMRQNCRNTSIQASLSSSFHLCSSSLALFLPYIRGDWWYILFLYTSSWFHIMDSLGSFDVLGFAPVGLRPSRGELLAGWLICVPPLPHYRFVKKISNCIFSWGHSQRKWNSWNLTINLVLVNFTDCGPAGQKVQLISGAWCLSIQYVKFETVLICI